MRYSSALDDPDDKFRRLTGVKQQTFEKTVAVLTEAHARKSRHPGKRGRKHPLTQADKRFNREVSRERILNSM